jgi:hypothetical protein
MGLQTYDARTIDSTGAFLIGELERLDPIVYAPLVSVTWGRDIDLREDVTIGDEISSFAVSSFGAPGNIIPGGKNWVGKDVNAIAGVALDLGKVANPLYLWAMEAGWTLPELASAMQLGRPIDRQKLDAVQLKHQMDIDEQVYIGDTTIGVTGLTNNTSVTATNAVNGASGYPFWANKTPDEILADVTTVETNAYIASGFTTTPSKIIVPPTNFSYIVSNRLPNTRSSILEYLRENSMSNAMNGKPLEIVPSKWLTGRGVGGTNRMVAYTQDKSMVRFPLVPLQRTPLEYRALSQLTYYYGRLGVVEVVRPQTLYYLDSI